MNSPDISGKPEGYEENLTLVDREILNDKGQALVECTSEEKTLLDKGECTSEEKTLSDKGECTSEEKTLSDKGECTSEEKTLSNSQDLPDRAEAKSGTWSVREVIDSLYRVENIVTGGMGVIYFVDHLKWGIKLVVKSPREEFLSKENKARFVREAETWVDLGKHPNIATAFYVREMQGIPRIFIEYADGGSLADWLREENLRELPEILDFAIQFCSGMVYAHSRDLVHRDIKADNVLLMKDGTVKITDFGLVKTKKKDIETVSPASIEKPSSISQQEWQTLTSATAVGTPPYMPPEQWLGADKTDRRSDVYSFGVMLYEMICGRRPFVKEPDNPYPTVIAYQMMHRFTLPPDPDQFRDGIPKTLKNLLMKCLEKDSTGRYSSFEEIQDVLTGVYREVRGKDYERILPGEAELKAEDLNNRALSYLDLGRKSDARKFLEEAIKIDPHSLCANINLILLLTDEAWESYENILLRFKSVREGNISNPLPYYYEAIFELLHGNPHHGLSLINKSLELDKSNGMLLNIKGVILTDLKKYNEALKVFQEAINVDKENMEYLRNYAASLYYNGRGQESCDEFSKLLDLFPEDSDLKIDLSVAMTGIKKFDRARVLLEEVIENNPMSLRANLYMGEIISGKGTFVPSFHSFSEPGDRDIALKYLQKACSLAPHVPRVRESLSECSGNKILPSSCAILQRKKERELIYPEAGEIKKLQGAGGKITGVIFSGENFAISSNTDSLLELWDLRDRKSIKKLSEEGSYMKFEALNVAVSYRYIASAHSDDTVKLWHKETGEFIRSFYGHSNIVRSINFSPDGTLLASSGADETVNIWDVESGKSLITAGKNTGIIYCVRFSPDGAYVATGTQKNSLQLWNVKSGDCYKQFYGHNGPVLNIAFSPDGRYILSGSEDKTLKLWDIDKEICIKTFSGHDSSVESVDFSPHGFHIVSGCSNGSVKVWDISTGEPIRTISEHTSSVTSVKFSPSGRNLLTASRDKTLRYISLPFKSDKIYNATYRREYLIVKPRTVEESLQDVEAFEKLLSEGEKKVREGQWKEGNDIFRKALNIQGFSKDVRALSGLHKSGEGGIREGIRSIWLFKIFSDSPGRVNNVSISDNNLVVYGGADKTVRVKKLQTGENVKSFSDRGEIVKISREGKFILSSEDKKFKFYDLSSDRPLRIISENLDCKSMNIFPGSFYVVTGGGMTDSTVKIWNIESGECLRTLKGHSSSVETVVLSKDGRTILSGSDDKTLKLWDVESGRCTGNFQGHTLPVTCSDISPYGKIVSSSQDRTVRIWDIRSEKCLKILKDHRSEVTSVAFSPDGKFIVSGSTDNTVRIWNIDTGDCLRILEDYSSAVTDVKFSPDGRYIITATMDGMVKIWEIDWNWTFLEEIIPQEKTVLMPQELVIEAKDELIADSTRYVAGTKKEKNILSIVGICALAVIVICLAFIPSCIRDSKKGKARFLMKKLYEQKFDPDSGRWNMNAKLLLDLGKPAIDVVIDEGLSDKKGMAQLNALKLMDMFKNTDYVRKKAKNQLIKLLSDSDPAVRGEAARLIGKYGFVEALPSLKEALNVENTGKWSDVEMELIETKKIQTYTGGERTPGQTYNKIVYYECTSCHGEMQFKPDEICAEARLKPWDYTRNTMKKAVEMLQ